MGLSCLAVPQSDAKLNQDNSGDFSLKYLEEAVSFRYSH